jgi:O-antigen biosynthesis protein WbqP
MASTRRMLKRTFDLIIALVALVAAIPLCLVLGLIIRATTPGPAFFIQTRVGRNGQDFKILKFRTMAMGTAERATREISATQVTPIGRLLRKSKLDELPQLWNVARGHMSLVGPRPCLPNQTELIKARKRPGVDTARPGITGLAQVHGIDMSSPHLLAAIDGLYVRRRTFCGDMHLILATLGLAKPPGSKVKRLRSLKCVETAG